MSYRKEVLCIRCPKGCRLRLKIGDEVIVEGQECKLGVEYGRKEASSPERVVPSTVKITGARFPRLPVRSEKGVPMNKIEEIIDELRGIEVKAPVKKGAVIVENVADTSVDIIAERDMEVKG